MQGFEALLWDLQPRNWSVGSGPTVAGVTAKRSLERRAETRALWTKREMLRPARRSIQKCAQCYTVGRWKTQDWCKSLEPFWPKKQNEEQDFLTPMQIETKVLSGERKLWWNIWRTQRNISLELKWSLLVLEEWGRSSIFEMGNLFMKCSCNLKKIY